MKGMPNIIIRATQKKMMSKPVTSTDEGRKVRRYALAASVSASPVQPSVEWHHSADENQVSSTSSSWMNVVGSRPSFATAFARAADSSCATYTVPASSYHAGMRWPHHNWREMHQSWMLVSHSL